MSPCTEDSSAFSQQSPVPGAEEGERPFDWILLEERRMKVKAERQKYFSWEHTHFFLWINHSHINIICNANHAATDPTKTNHYKRSSPNISFFSFSLTLDVTNTVWLAFYPRYTSVCSKKVDIQLAINIAHCNNWIFTLDVIYKE